jgi:hypothetical protein
LHPSALFALYLKLELHTKTWFWNLAIRNNTFFTMFIKLPTWFLFQNCDTKTLMIISRNAVKLVEFTFANFGWWIYTICTRNILQKYIPSQIPCFLEKKFLNEMKKRFKKCAIFFCHNCLHYERVLKILYLHILNIAKFG